MTFSIVALDPKTKALGIAVSTGVPAVGSAVPHVKENVGAIATQGQTNRLYGTEGLNLLKSGIPPQDALKTMLLQDKEHEKRQIIMIDVHGRTAAFTGKETIDWRGHLIGKNHVVAGNLLVGERVIETMHEAFETEAGALTERLLKALEVGQHAGGDKRGSMSAALLVADARWKRKPGSLLDLRVDAHLDPVKELRRVYEVSRGYFQVSE